MSPDKDEQIAALDSIIIEQSQMINRLYSVVFPLAMIDRDNMTEHDEALLEEAIVRAKEIVK